MKIIKCVCFLLFLFCILSHLMQQELPLFEEKKSGTPGFTYPIEELGRGEKLHCSQDKKSGINHLTVPWGYLNNVQ